MADSHDVVVVGGGITGLAAAFEINTKSPGSSLVVLEKADRAGGTIGSYRHDGYTVDLGPHGFVDNGHDVRYLVDRLNLQPHLVPATAEAQNIFLLKDDRLYRVPSTPGVLLRTPLLSARGKARLLAEVMVPRRLEEESAVDFVARRFGREAAEVFAVPAVRGVIGGDAQNFSIEGEFPLIKQLERKYRSVLVGAVRVQAQRRRVDPVATRFPSFREFGMRLKTFREIGMQCLVDALEKALAEKLRLGSAVERLARDNDGWRVVLRSGEQLTARQVVLALPTEPTARLLRPHLPSGADELDAIPHPDIRVIALGYRRADVGVIPRGIGFVATPNKDTNILGAIHASTIFPEQAPRDAVMIRALAGGMRDASILSVSRDDAVELIHRDLSKAFAIRGEPVFSFEHLWPQAIPVYPVGHRPRMDVLVAKAASLGGLHLAGSTYYGVGANDCVRDALRAADAVLTRLR